MRLQPHEVQVIREAILSFDPHARIFLFGSRVHPTRKGGDIDLLVLSQCLKDIDSIKIIKRIYENMEEQKIDMLITSETKDPFVQIALKEGIEL